MLGLDQHVPARRPARLRARPRVERAPRGPRARVSTARARSTTCCSPSGGTALLYLPFLNYADGNLDAVGEMLQHPHTVPGLGDGGAHVGTICDGSFPTTLLTHWGRDRDRGPRFEVPWLVKRQTADTAAAVGLLDRGRARAGLPGRRQRHRLRAPRPGAPRRSCSTCPPAASACCSGPSGYCHTFVAGEETYVDGEATGALPGPVRARGAAGARERRSLVSYADHLGRLAHHRAAEHLHRLHRPGVPRPGAEDDRPREARRRVRHRRHVEADARWRRRPPPASRPRRSGHTARSSTTCTAAAGIPTRAWPTRIRDGVAAEIIYPTVGMILCNHTDLDYKQACFEAYNRWIARVLLRASRPAARPRPDRDAHRRRKASPTCTRSRPSACGA